MECLLKLISFLLSFWIYVQVSSGSPLQSKKLNGRGPRDCDETQYWHRATSTCKECSTICEAGFELDSECGWGDGSDGRCQKCLPGTFQSGNDYYCSTCSFCKNRQTIKKCTLTQDTQCGDCLPGFMYHTQVGMCVKCNTNCPQPTTRSIDVVPTPSIPTSPDPVGPVSTRKMINSSFEKPKIEPSVSRGTHNSERFIVVIVFMLSLLVLMVAVVITWKIRGSLKRTVCEKFSCPDTTGEDRSARQVVSLDDVENQSGTSDCLLEETSFNSGHSSTASLQNLSQDGEQDVIEDGDDLNSRYAAVILSIDSDLKTQEDKFLNLREFTCNAIDDHRRGFEECGSFNDLVKMLQELEKYSKTNPCLLVQGLHLVGRIDLAGKLHRATFCSEHKKKTCYVSLDDSSGRMDENRQVTATNSISHSPAPPK